MIPALNAQAPARAWTLHAKWKFGLGLALLALVLASWPHGYAYLRYDRSGLAHWELWRLLTGHLVHLTPAHLFLNCLGLFLICELLWHDLPLRHGIGLSLSAATAISGALWWLHPELAWYAGLSGVVHALWAGCALYGLLLSGTGQPERFVARTGALLLIAKLVLEYFHGPSSATAQLLGATIITPAHLYGALAGAAYVFVLYCARIRVPSRGALQQQYLSGSGVRSRKQRRPFTNPEWRKHERCCQRLYRL